METTDWNNILQKTMLSSPHGFLTKPVHPIFPNLAARTQPALPPRQAWRNGRIRSGLIAFKMSWRIDMFLYQL